MDFRDHSISDLVKRVKNKEISAKELTESAISNIEKYDGAINAFCALNNEDAIKQAESLDKILQPLHSALFIESNPSPVKYAASLLGMCNPSVRLPLVEIREETKKKVSEALKVAKLL